MVFFEVFSFSEYLSRFLVFKDMFSRFEAFKKNSRCTSSSLQWATARLCGDEDIFHDDHVDCASGNLMVIYRMFLIADIQGVNRWYTGCFTADITGVYRYSGLLTDLWYIGCFYCRHNLNRYIYIKGVNRLYRVLLPSQVPRPTGHSCQSGNQRTRTSFYPI